MADETAEEMLQRVLSCGAHRYTACLDFRRDRWHGYVMGYRDAAETLMLRLEEQNCDQDFLCFPIVFLYRHHIELMLKSLWRLRAELGQGRPEYPTQHALLPIWNDLWPWVKDEGGRGTIAFGRSVRTRVELLDRLDRGSTAFRYPETGDGEPQQLSTWLDLAAFAAEMRTLSDSLGAIACYFIELGRALPHVDDSP